MSTEGTLSTAAQKGEKESACLTIGANRRAGGGVKAHNSAIIRPPLRMMLEHKSCRAVKMADPLRRAESDLGQACRVATTHCG